MKETKARSIVKAVTYRFSATIATLSVAYFFIGDVAIATQIGLLDTVVKFLLYYINERIWNNLDWGYQTVFPNQEIQNQGHE